MRNLKRALSLALASVMLLGMMVVGTSAASYPDVDENDNVEAIEVLNAVNVMIGRQGNFEPDEAVNRHEMAVIMAKLVLGVDTADSYVGTHPFTDVVPWADKYVAACYENGLVAGKSATTYNGGDPLTAVEAAAMMLRALGYKDLEKTGTPWSAPITAMANQIRLFSGVASNPNEKLNRNQVAQLALNTLKSPMVNLKDNTISWSNNDGQLIMTGGSREYIALSSHEAYAKAINDTERAGTSASGIEGWTVELGEHLYNGKLKLNSNAKDVFGRPSNNWQYDGKDVGTYVNYDLRVAEYKTGVTGAQLYDLLTYTTINDNDLLTWIDGVDSNVSKDRLVRSNKDNVNGSNTGVLTEVFVDLDHKEVTISAINTYLAQANSDYNKTNETLSLNVYQTNGTGSTKIVDVKDVPEVADVLKDDYRLVYLSGWEEATSLTDYTRFHVVDMFDVEIMAESSVTKWSDSSSKVVDKLTTGGTEYKSNVKAFYDMDHVFGQYNDQLLTDTSYNIYLDRYGNVIGVDLAEGNKNYVFITGYDRGVSHISVKTADAAAIFMDGTMDTIVVNVTDTDKNITNAKNSVNGAAYGEYLTWQTRSAGAVDHNRWYTYTVASNGTYTLKPVENFAFTAYTAPANYTDTTRTLNSANLFLDDSGVTNKGRFYGNDDSVYLTVSAGRVDMSSGDKTDDTDPAGKTDIADVKDAIADVEGVYTGAQNVKIDLKPEIKQETNTSDACYTSKVAEKNAYVYSIFDKNYYIIASVVLGEAQGAATNYIYTLDGAKSERVEHGSNSRAAADDTYYWEVDAVVNGEKTTLTVKSKYHQTVDIINANVNKLVEVRYDGEYVTKIDPVNTGKIFTNQYSETKIEDMKVYDVGGVAGIDWKLTTTGDNGGYVHYKSGNVINATLNGNDKNGNEGNCRRISGNIELVGRTLYTDRARGDVGLALAADAKAVLVQPENGKVQTINCGSVSEAVGRLADRNPNTAAKEFKGRVVAVLNSAGVAQWVVIISDTNLATGNKPNYDQTNSVTFGNIRVDVVGMSTNGVTGYLDADGDLFIVLPKLTKAVDPDDKYDVDVYVNGVYMGVATFVKATNASVIYSFDGIKMTDKMEIVAVVEAKETPATTYDVTIGTITGGTVTASPTKAAAGTTVTLTGTPTTAGHVPSYTVTWTGGNVAVAANGTFTMPVGAVTVNATFTDPSAKTYDITVTQPSTGGTISASATKAAEGTEITLTATPTTAGETATFTVTKASGGTVTVTNGKFTMPAENVTVTAVFSKAPPAGDLANAPGAHKVVAENGAVTVDLFYEGSTDPYTDAAAKKTAVAEALGVSEDALVINGNTATYVENGAPKTATISATKRVYKVSLAGSDSVLGYIKDSASGDDLKLASTSFTNGATYILGDASGDAQKVSDGAELTVADGKITFTSVTTDVVLYEAVQVTFNSTNDDVKYLLPDSVGVAWAAVTNEDWLPVNSKLQVKGKATDGDGLDGSGNYSAAGKTALVLNDSVNGSPVAVTTGSAAKEFTIDVTKANAKNGVMDVATAMVYEVKNNGSAMGTKTYYATGAKIYVAANTFDSAKKYVGEGTKSTTGITFTTSEETGNQTYTVAAADAVNGVINIKEAVNIQFAPGATFSLSDTIAAVNSAGAASYVAKGSTLYVQAAANNSWIAVKAADAAKVTLGEVVATKKPAYNAKGVWKVTVNDNITADPFEAVLTGATVTITASADHIGNANQTEAITLTAKFATAPTADDVTLATVSGNAIANLTFEFASATTTGLVINLKSGAAAVATSTDPINVTVDGMTVQIKIGS